MSDLQTIQDYGDDAGLGTGGLSIDEQRLPRLMILHMSSPQCLRGHEAHVPGAQAGNLFNTATQEVYDGDQGIEFLSCWREKVYTAWAPREEGGGFRGEFRPDDPTVVRAIHANVQRLGARRGRFGKIPFRSDDGEDLELTEQWNLGMIYGAPTLTPATAQRVMMPLTSTKIRTFVLWVQRADAVEYVSTDGKRQRPPSWGQRWRLTTASMNNNKGSWYVPVFSQAPT